MRYVKPTIGALAACAMWLVASGASAQDWPQWRGPNRDAKVTGFTAPKTWPKELTQKWKVTVGEGVATPALVGDKLYVFSRQDGNEVIRCLDAGTGKEIWQDKYESAGADRPAQSFSGPRSSPAVADGKVVLLGVRGILSCYDAASGKKVWRKDESEAIPQFATSSSPLIADGLCIVQLGSETSGGMVAYDLTSGTEKWKWSGDGTAYASPVLLTVDGTKAVVAETAKMIVAIALADGKQLWTTSFPKQGRSYNACTPVIDGQTVIFSGAPRGTKAVKLEKKGDEFAAKELWANKDTSVQFNSPVVHDGAIFGVSNDNKLFCLSMEGGTTSWTAAMPGAPAGGGGGRPPGGPGGPPGGGGRPGGGGMGGGMGGGGYGSVVDAGSVLFALSPGGKLVVFEPNNKEFKQIANYKVAEPGGAEKSTHAYPVIAGNRIFIKDSGSVTLWTIE